MHEKGKKLRKYKKIYRNTKQQHLEDLKKRSLNFYDIHAKNNAIIQSYYPINIDNIDTKTQWFLTRFYLAIKVLFFDKKILYLIKI